jgi:UDP-N-acetylglucosamine/UDP-N-acetylgalactosamine diphosphorylase
MTENPENLMKMCLNDMYISVSFLNSLKNNHEKSMKFS